MSRNRICTTCLTHRQQFAMFIFLLLFFSLPTFHIYTIDANYSLLIQNSDNWSRFWSLGSMHLPDLDFVFIRIWYSSCSIALTISPK